MVKRHMIFEIFVSFFNIPLASQKCKHMVNDLTSFKEFLAAETEKKLACD